MAEPLVSTVVSCYHGERYLPAFLENFRSQTLFEQIRLVIDLNMPSDTELGIIRKFEVKFPERIKVLTADPLLPYGASWNRCIGATSSEFLTIWNIDDLRAPDSIEAEVSLLQKRPDVDVVYGDYTVVKQFGSTQGDIVSCKETSAEMHTRKLLLGPFFMFRRSALSKAGMIDEQLKIAADYDFGLRLAFNGKVERCEQMLGYYLDAGTGLSTSPSRRRYIENTVLNLRYGVYDELNFEYLPETHGYNIYQMLSNGKWRNVSDHVPNYEMILRERYEKWFDLGATYHITRNLRTKDRGLERFRRFLLNWSIKNKMSRN